MIRGDQKRETEKEKSALQTHLFEPGEVFVEVNGSLHAPSPSLPVSSLLLSDFISNRVCVSLCGK